jgi:hypothetical protein
LLGRRVEWTQATGRFHVRPLWSYVGRLRTDLLSPQGEVVQVFADNAARFRDLLDSPEAYASLPTPRLERYLVFADSDYNWPGLVVRVAAVDSHVVARVTTVSLAKSLADTLNRIEDEEARKPKSWGYWWRAF